MLLNCNPATSLRIFCLGVEVVMPAHWAQRPSHVRLYVLEQFEVHSKIEKKVNRSLMYTLPHTYTTSSLIKIPQQSGTFVTIDKSILTHPNPPKFIVHIMDYSWCYTFCGFEQIE